MSVPRHRLITPLAFVAPIAFAAPLAFAAALIAQAAQSGSELVPSLPIEFESVHLRMTVDSCAFNPYTVRVAHDGQRIAITQQPNACLLPGTPKRVDVQLGALPVGRYRVDVFATGDTSQDPVESIAFDVVSRLEIAVFPPPPRPIANYSGVWWDPAKPGFGLMLQQSAQYDGIFGAHLGFDAAGTPAWNTLQGGHWVDTTTWEGVLYRTTMPAGDEPSPVTEPVGTVTLAFGEFPATGQARMRTTIDGVVTMRHLSRPRW